MVKSLEDPTSFDAPSVLIGKGLRCADEVTVGSSRHLRTWRSPSFIFNLDCEGKEPTRLISPGPPTSSLPFSPSRHLFLVRSTLVPRKVDTCSLQSRHLFLTKNFFLTKSTLYEDLVDPIILKPCKPLGLQALAHLFFVKAESVPWNYRCYVPVEKISLQDV